MKMITPSNVELTKVFYYDKSKSHRNMEIPSVSREVCRGAFDKNTVIKRNIFGHTWVLKINESAEPKVKEKCDAKVVLYVWVFCCIIVAISFGIYFSVESKYSQIETEVTSRFVPKQASNQSQVEDDINEEKTTSNVKVSKGPQSRQEHTNETIRFTNEASNKIICNECNQQKEICLKIEEAEPPRCVKILDPKDPTGCGGLCEINTQHCRLLDIDIRIYQCTKNKNVLRCPDEEFNCGNRCITRDKRCDGVFHCTNFSDEENCQCDLNKNFHCGNNTSCLPLAKQCDGFVDCWDKSDEVDCTKVSACNEDESPCHNGRCIKKEKFCDGVYDCSDESDEPQGCQI